MVGTPGDADDGQLIERVTLDIRLEDFEFISQLAGFRNAMARAQSKKLKKQWSRKSLAESFIANECSKWAQDLADAIAACGPLPEWNATNDVTKAKSKAEMDKYVGKVLAWDKKRPAERKRLCEHCHKPITSGHE